MDSAVAEPLGPEDPREIGQFTILGLLGTGGMGEVYLGTRDGRYVAVKRVRPRLVSGERFNREVAILHRVPLGVAPSLLASDSTAPAPWFATEYVPGLTVDDAVRSYGALPADALWLLLSETAAQLQAVHEAAIVHRDLKPANIMLVRDGVKLIDFGIALAGDQSRLTRDGASSGTRGFVAPEQDAGNRDVAAPADVYSLAATLAYAASTIPPGALPDVGPLRAVDAELAGIVESCLAADPARRPSAADLAASARGHISDRFSERVSPSWPPAVMERIEARRAFAATPVEKLETVLPPEPGPTKPLPDRPPTSRWRPFAVPGAAVVALGAAVAIALAVLPKSDHQGSGTPGTDVLSNGIVAASGGTSTSSAGLPGTTPPGNQASSPTPTGPATPGGSTGPGGSTTSAPGSVSTKPDATSADGSAGNGGATPPGSPGGSTKPSTVPSTAPGSTAPKPTPPEPTSSSIPGVNSADDPARVSGSEVDAHWVANDATCSAWLDTDGSGDLAAVLNTSLYQSCVAELFRSDGMAYTFSQSQGAKKTNFISDIGYTMWICVWHADEQSDTHCSPHYGMSGTTPVSK